MPIRWLVLFLALNSSAQEFKIHADVELVLLDVSVKNPTGGYVTGLTKDQFQIYKNAALQKITQFAAADPPVAAGLAMDYSASMVTLRATLIAACVAFRQA